MWYFRNRKDYNRSLGPLMPNIGMSLGVYHERTRRAYFFADGKGDQRTLYHEATHQLFHESRPVAPDVGRKTNFWIVEGIAMFMESLRQENGYYTLGGFDDQRLYAAKYRFTHDHFYIPLGEFVDIGIAALQTRPANRQTLQPVGRPGPFLWSSTTAAAIATRWSPISCRLHRPRRPQDPGPTLTGATGYDELDKEYRKFIEAGR